MAVRSRRRAGPGPVTVAMWPSPERSDNPYLSELCAGLRADGVQTVPVTISSLRSAQLIHLHWPDLMISRPGRARTVLAAAAVLSMVALCRLAGRPTVWTVHNLTAHDSCYPGLEAAFWWAFTRLIAGYLSLTAAGIELAEQRHPALAGRPRAVVPHGTYRDAYPSWPDGALAARRQHKLPEDGDGLLFLGQLRRYKGVPALLDSFAGVSLPGAFLAVAGECRDTALADQLRLAALGDPRVVLSLARVPDELIGSWFAATAGTVLPFHAGLNSGSVFLSLTMGRPVLVPETPVFTELSGQVGGDWVQCYRQLTAHRLAEFLGHAGALVTSGRLPDLSRFEWPVISAQTARFYRQVLA